MLLDIRICIPLPPGYLFCAGKNGTMTAVLNISIYTFGPALLFRPGVNTFKPARGSSLFQVNLAHNKDQATKEIRRLRIEINPRKDCCGLSLALFIPLSRVVSGISV